MPELVSKEGRLYRIANQQALGELVQQLGLSSDLAKYLRQMCGFRQLPGDQRSGKHRAFGWSKLDDVRWLRRNGSRRYHVAFGAKAEDIYKNMPELKAELTPSQRSRSCWVPVVALVNG